MTPAREASEGEVASVSVQQLIWGQREQTTVKQVSSSQERRKCEFPLRGEGETDNQEEGIDGGHQLTDKLMTQRDRMEGVDNWLTVNYQKQRWKWKKEAEEKGKAKVILGNHEPCVVLSCFC